MGREITEIIIGAAIEVHRRLGPSLRERAYQKCLSRELQLRSTSHRIEVPVPVRYKEVHLDCGYRADLLVENSIVVELKTVAELLGLHDAQLLTQLKLGGWRLGLLLNFRELTLKDGVKRMVCDSEKLRRIAPRPSAPPVPRGSASNLSLDKASGEIIAAAIEVHRNLGPGLLASAYEECLCYELSCRGLGFERRSPIQVDYEGLLVPEAGEMDLLVNREVVVKVLATDETTALDLNSWQGDLHLTGAPVGLLLNFSFLTMKEGIRRCINSTG